MTRAKLHDANEEIEQLKSMNTELEKLVNNSGKGKKGQYVKDAYFYSIEYQCFVETSNLFSFYVSTKRLG